MDLRLVWGKMAPDPESSRQHPLVCHMIDVATVAQAILALRRPLRQRFAEQLGLGGSPETAVGWISFWVGAHDIGKASPCFQARDEEAKTLLATKLGYRFRGPFKAHHNQVTTKVLPDLLVTGVNWPTMDGNMARRISTAVGAHHGAFVRSGEITGGLLGRREVGDGSWCDLRRQLMIQLALACKVGRQACKESATIDDHTFFMLLAGLTSVADWIGSDEEYFPYAGPEVDLSTYAARARQQADHALKRVGWPITPAPRQLRTFTDLFEKTPRPLQEVTARLCEGIAEPSLLLIEAPTGEGKTEAALYFADCCATGLGQEGFYIALPTQATSNQMFARAREFLRKRRSAHVELHLLHGQAILSEDYRRLRPMSVGSDQEDRAGNLTAHEWFVNRKRGLLAPNGVGTIDQSLLAVLQTRHVFVRLFGLAHKTVIFDEVHAYDTYMYALLQRLLEWLASLGCSVILLSATLPASFRKALVSAYTGSDDLPDQPYPRITYVQGRQPAQVESIEVSPTSCKALRFAHVGRNPETLAELLTSKLRQGGCAAVICNTVGRAQQVYQALKPQFAGTDPGDGGPELDLLHARFPFDERDEREKRCIRRFGLEARANDERPRCSVLVATQIIEQSLDLDFDLMVSDLAPVDLVLQRAGRLHRHRDADGCPFPRPPSLEQPMLYLAMPEAQGDDVPDFGADEWVYDRYVLLRSYLALRRRGHTSIQMPDDVEQLIEEVYGSSTPSELPDDWLGALANAQTAALAEQDSDQRQARIRTILPPSYADDIMEDFNLQLEEDNPDVHRTLQAMTRQTRPSVSLICLHDVGGTICMSPDGAEPIDPNSPPNRGDPEYEQWLEHLIRRSLTLTHPGIVRHYAEARPPAAWRRASMLRHHRLAVFTAGRAEVGTYTIQLDPELGVVVTRTGGTITEDD